MSVSWTVDSSDYIAGWRVRRSIVLVVYIGSFTLAVLRMPQWTYS